MKLNHTILGRCEAVMPTLPAESVDLIVTSPPYNLRNSTGGSFKYGRTGGMWNSSKLANGYDNHDDDMPHDEYVAWQRQCLTEMLRLLKPDGAIFYNHKWRVQKGLLQDRSDILAGFPVRQIIIWERAGGPNFNLSYFHPRYEVIYLICKPGFKLTRQGIHYGDVWKIAQDRKNPFPAPMPLELAKRCIESTAATVVMDPFMGSGTTAIAAEELGRNWIGIEKSPITILHAEARMVARKVTSAVVREMAKGPLTDLGPLRGGA